VVGYGLGVDLGTTYTAAAVCRDGARPEMVDLGERSPVIPSVVFAATDGSLVVGEPAARRGAAEPERLARQFKRRFGDAVPLFLDGVPRSPDGLSAAVLRWVVARVSERQGGPPERVVLTHPANWGQYKLDLLGQVIERAELDSAQLLSEPQAAGAFYASTERVADGAVVLVYDLGGGTFDAAVLRRIGTGFAVVGEPTGLERVGGMDFDEAVWRHVLAGLDGRLDGLDDSDPDVAAGLARLREDCIVAKEALSVDTDAVVTVGLPGLHTRVRVVRHELEAMIRPVLDDTLAATRRAVRSAGIDPDQIATVLLVGGSSRIPLVAQTVSAELGRPVAVDAHPKHAVALGAALTAAATDEALPAPPAMAAEPAGQVEETAEPVPAGYPYGPDMPARADSASRVRPSAPDDPTPIRSRRARYVVLGAAVVLAAVILTVTTRNQQADAPAPSTATAPTTAAAGAATSVAASDGSTGSGSSVADGTQLARYTVDLPVGSAADLGVSPPTGFSALSGDGHLTGDIGLGRDSYTFEENNPVLFPEPNPPEIIGSGESPPTYQACTASPDITNQPRAETGLSSCVFEPAKHLLAGVTVTQGIPLGLQSTEGRSVTLDVTIWQDGAGHRAY
jgi:molecular chaperone DnaK